MTLQLTPLAIQKAKETCLKYGISMLRIGVRGGGCNGYFYIIEPENAAKIKDIIIDFDQLKIVIDQKSMILLNNTTIDYEIKLMTHGFKFINPDIKSECSCGKSFAI